jgi:predicted lipoprotein with Yx(FWY)xxD motif
MRTIRAITITAACLALVACGDDDEADTTEVTAAAETTAAIAESDTTTAAPASTDATGASSTVTTTATDLGEILTLDGFTLYAFTQDEQGAGTSTCNDDCAGVWPPVPADTDVGEEVTAEASVVVRDDGSEQLAIDGWPMYFYTPDAAGDTGGQGVGGVWFVVDASGVLVR